MKTIGCIIARTNSKRLPQKVLRDINGKKMIEYIIDKMKKVENLDDIYLCTSIDEDDNILIEIAKENNIKFYQGSRESVIDRILDVAKLENADNVVRITGDNIFTDEIFLQKMIKEHNKNNADYTRTEYLPIGLTAEVMKVSALKHCYDNIDPNKSEYLLLYMFNPNIYNCQVLIPHDEYKCEYASLTVDTIEDFERSKYIINNLQNKVYYDEILKLHKEKGIPNFSIDRELKVKLPDEESISYMQFRKLMEIRISKSNAIYLERNFYEKNKY